MGALNSGALTVSIILNHLYPMIGAKTRNFTLLPVRGTSFTAVVGHLEACVLLGNYNTDTSHLLILEYKREKYWQDDFEG